MEERTRRLQKRCEFSQNEKQSKECENGRKGTVGHTSVSRSEEEMDELVGEDGGGNRSLAGFNISFRSLCIEKLRMKFEWEIKTEEEEEDDDDERENWRIWK